MIKLTSQEEKEVSPQVKEAIRNAIYRDFPDSDNLKVILLNEINNNLLKLIQVLEPKIEKDLSKDAKQKSTEVIV